MEEHDKEEKRYFWGDRKLNSTLGLPLASLLWELERTWHELGWLLWALGCGRGSLYALCTLPLSLPLISATALRDILWEFRLTCWKLCLVFLGIGSEKFRLGVTGISVPGSNP